MFSQKGVHECTWYQDTLTQQSMIDFVVESSDLRPYVLDTRGKERSRAVNLSSPGGELDQAAGEEAGQTSQAQANSEGLLEMSG